MSISKVLEKLVDSHVSTYLKYYDVLYSKQFGFGGAEGAIRLFCFSRILPKKILPKGSDNEFQELVILKAYSVFYFVKTHCNVKILMDFT